MSNAILKDYRQNSTEQSAIQLSEQVITTNESIIRNQWPTPAFLQLSMSDHSTRIQKAKKLHNRRYI
jgi:hypothetical protein